MTDDCAKDQKVLSHMHKLCDTDTELWRTKLDWSQCERGRWVDEVYDTSSIWMGPLISDDEMEDTPPETRNSCHSEPAASATPMRLLNGPLVKR